MMFSRYLTAGISALVLSACLWGAAQQRRAAHLADRLSETEATLAQIKSQLVAAQRANAALDTVMQTMRQQAAEAEQVRAQIEELADDTPTPDWLSDLPRRLRAAADRAANNGP